MLRMVTSPFISRNYSERVLRCIGAGASRPLRRADPIPTEPTQARIRYIINVAWGNETWPLTYSPPCSPALQSP